MDNFLQIIQVILIPFALFYFGVIEKRLLVIKDQIAQRPDRQEMQDLIDLNQQVRDVKIADLKEDIQELKSAIKELTSALRSISQ